MAGIKNLASKLPHKTVRIRWKMSVEYFTHCLAYVYLLFHKWKLVELLFPENLVNILRFCVLTCILKDL